MRVKAVSCFRSDCLCNDIIEVVQLHVNAKNMQNSCSFVSLQSCYYVRKDCVVSSQYVCMRRVSKLLRMHKNT